MPDLLRHDIRRDFFAAHALQALMMRHTESGYSDFDAVVEAYRIADVMNDVRQCDLPPMNPPTREASADVPR